MSTNIKNCILKARELLCLEEAVRCGSITQAATNNGMKQSNMSAQIKNLELSLNEKLISRLSNGIKLTEVGYEYYSLACELKNIIEKSQNINTSETNISGAIRLWTSDGLGLGVLSQCFHVFYQKYPKVNVEITCSLDMPKLNEFDMALVFQKPQNKSLTVKKEYCLQFGLFASKEYLSKFGMPKNVKDLCLNHKICDRTNYASYSKKWADVVSNANFVTSVTNSSAMLLGLIKDGLGVGFLPIGTASKEPDLLELKNIPLHFELKFYLVVRRDSENTDKIKALSKIIDDESAKL